MKINWLDHIANLLVVILGITIAFYLEGYREDKANQRQEAKYIGGLIKDLETDLEVMDTLIQVNRLIADAVVYLSDATIGESYDKDSLGIKLLSIQYNPPFDPQRITYESLKSSGDMDLISDFELRNGVIELYEQYYKGTDQYDDVIDQNLRDLYKPYYVKNIVFTSRMMVKDDFLDSHEFANIIFVYRFLFLAKADFFVTVRDQLEKVIGELKDYQSKDR